MSRHFHEALIQAEVVTNGILPALLVLFVIREVFHYVLVDAVQGEPLLGTAANGHHDESVVAVSGFFTFAFVGRFRGARWWSPGAGDVELGVGGGGRAGRGLREEVSDREAVRRRHGAASRAAHCGLSFGGDWRGGPASAVPPSHQTPPRGPDLARPSARWPVDTVTLQIATLLGRRRDTFAIVCSVSIQPTPSG